MTIIDSIKNNVILSVINAVEKKVDGREIAKDISEDIIKPNLGEGVSVRLQREPITQFLLEMLEGFWGDDKRAFTDRIMIYANNIRKQLPDPME